MKKRIYLIVARLVAIGAIAAFAFAQTTDIFIDKNPLATNETKANAKLLPSRYVYDMLARFDQVCEIKDGQKILDQLSLRVQTYILKHKPASQSLYDHLAYMCKDMRKIGKTLRAPDLTFYTFKQGNKVELCFRAPSDSKCKGELDVAFEDNKLTINEI
ncbi:MAG: hypothetical protein LBN32_00770 [Helicobacteraceae bacterium]|jgi:hypothetical protein|nr:hypothetical protein [Helicobacteraceae bacterium]